MSDAQKQKTGSRVASHALFCLDRRFRAGIIAGAIAAALVLIGAWIGGFDFDQRGKEALSCYVGSVLSFLFVAMATITCPLWDE